MAFQASAFQRAFQQVVEAIVSATPDIFWWGPEPRRKKLEREIEVAVKEAVVEVKAEQPKKPFAPRIPVDKTYEVAIAKLQIENEELKYLARVKYEQKVREEVRKAVEAEFRRRRFNEEILLLA